jgi:GNAT superfamily N-acetyltransferase
VAGQREPAADLRIARVERADLAELLPMMEAYCDFYGTEPGEQRLRELAEALLADPEGEGVQLIARVGGAPAGFATVYWSWSTTTAARIAVMNDLFVNPEQRGSGAAEALIAGCAEEARAHGADRVEWQTAPANERAQAVYERVGATRESWVDYWLAVPPRA